MDKSTIVIAYAGEDSFRRRATMRAQKHMAEQPGSVDRVFVHLAMPGEGGLDEMRDCVEKSGARYVRLTGAERHRFVFHKEDLYNHAVQYVLPHDVRNLIFLDADTHPEDLGWSRAVAERMAGMDDDTVLQPWSTFSDTRDPRMSGTSMARRLHDDGGHWRSHANPGLCVAMTRGCFDSIGGFPVSCPAGAADTMLMQEVFQGPGGPPYRELFPYFEEAMRDVPGKDIAHMDFGMVHEYHGSLKSRGYRSRHTILQAFWPFGDDVFVDDVGLLCVRPGSALQYCLQRRKNATGNAVASRLVREARRRCGEV